MAKAVVKVQVELPYELVREWLQHVRDFDARHFGEVELVILSHCPEWNSEQMQAVLKSIRPPYAQMVTMKNEES